MHALDLWAGWIRGRILKIVSQYDMHHSTNRPMRYNQSLERLRGALIGPGGVDQGRNGPGETVDAGFLWLTKGRQT